MPLPAFLAPVVSREVAPKSLPVARPVVEPLEERRLFAGATIRGTIYLDLNGDGRKGGPGERGVPDITVYVDRDNNEALDAGDAQTVTNRRGKYLFRGLERGRTYHVRQVVPQEYASITPPGAAWFVDLRFRANAPRRDAGYWPLSQGTPPIPGLVEPTPVNQPLSVVMYNTGATQGNAADGTNPRLLSGLAGEAANAYWAVQPPNPAGADADPLAFQPTYYSFSPTRYNGDLQPTSTHNDSTWVSPTRNATDASPAGRYVYATAFDLSGVEPRTVEVTGAVVADDAIVDVRINGSSLSLTGRPGVVVPFVIRTGFIPGVNTLEIVVDNETAGPTAVRVDALRGTGRKIEAGAVTLFNTGVSGPNNPVGGNANRIPTGGVDPNWQVSVPGAGFPFYADDAAHRFIYNNTFTSGRFGAAFVAQENPTVWDDDDLNEGTPGVDSSFINPVGDPGRVLPAGTYIYRTQFDLTGLDANTAAVTGTLMAAGQVVDIYVNGNPMNQGQGAGARVEFAEPFTITQGMVGGVNVLDIIVNNPQPGMGGIRVDGLHGTAAGAAPRANVAYPLRLPLPAFPPLTPPTGPFPPANNSGNPGGGLGTPGF